MENLLTCSGKYYLLIATSDIVEATRVAFANAREDLAGMFEAPLYRYEGTYPDGSFVLSAYISAGFIEDFSDNRFIRDIMPGVYVMECDTLSGEMLDVNSVLDSLGYHL